MGGRHRVLLQHRQPHLVQIAGAEIESLADLGGDGVGDLPDTAREILRHHLVGEDDDLKEPVLLGRLARVVVADDVADGRGKSPGHSELMSDLAVVGVEDAVLRLGHAHDVAGVELLCLMIEIAIEGGQLFPDTRLKPIFLLDV